MDQQGHHFITRVAVDRLFESAGNPQKILGHDKMGLYEALNSAQHHSDRIGYDGGNKLGNTWHPAVTDPEAQRYHSMADPYKTGAENLKDVRDFVSDKLSEAHAAFHERNYEYEWACLGAAIHALEDSYSSAHMFRDALTPDDPHAPVQALNVFAPLTDQQTHDGEFDRVPGAWSELTRGTDRAAAAAVAELLAVYISHVHDQPQQATDAFVNAVAPFFHGDDVQVFADQHSRSYLEQREAHLRNEPDPFGVPAHHAGADLGPVHAPDHPDTNIGLGMSLPEDGSSSVHHAGGMSLPEDGSSSVHHAGGMSLPEDGSSSVHHAGGMSLPEDGSGAVQHHDAMSMPEDGGASVHQVHADPHVDDGSASVHASGN